MLKYAALALLAVLLLSGVAYAETGWKAKIEPDLLAKFSGPAILSDTPYRVVVWGGKGAEHGSVVYRLDIVDASVVMAGLSGIEAMAREPGVSRIGLDRRAQINRAEGRPLIKADAAEAAYSVNGTGVKIAIIDTGVWNHTEFNNRTIMQKCFCTGCCMPGSVNENSNATDDHGHGTHVAGIAAGAEGNGTASNASIIAIKVFNSAGSGYDSDIAKGMEFAIDNGADIIHMSAGTSYDYFTNCYEAGLPSSKATDNATSQGKLVILSAGNSGSGSATIGAPACAKTPISVGNVRDTTGEVYTSSSRGPTDDNRTKPDVMAPGWLITSTYLSNGYYSTFGTSQAAPFVSGTAALLFQQYKRSHGSFPAPGLAKAIMINAVNNSAPRNNTYGSGMVDASEALRCENFTRTGTITQGQEIAYAFNVTSNITRATLVWMDNSTQSNNLDLKVQAPDGTNYSWGGDANDTVESVLMSSANGMWKLFVRAASASGSVAYYVAANGQVTSIDGLNVSSIQRGQSWGAWSVFGNPVNYSLTEYNVTSPLANFSSTVAGYVVNHTNATGNDWSLGWHSVRFYVNHSDGAWETSAQQSFMLWGWAGLNESIVNTSVVEDQVSPFACRVRDANTTAPISGYNVGIYLNSTYVATAPTNASGWMEATVEYSTPGVYNLSCVITNNASSYYNISVALNQTTVVVNDTTKPQYGALTNTTAVYDVAFQANATWTDNGRIGTVLFESNYSGALANYTAPNASSSYYFTILPGNHSGGKFMVWRWVANDTAGNVNATQQYNYTVSRAATLARLFLNNSEASTSYLRGSIINTTASLNISRNMTIYANFSGSAALIANGSSPSNYTNTSNLNASGSVYNITAAYDGNANYTESSATYYATVKDADGAACSAASSCYGGYCVHGSCRPASTYCGDSHCDTGETTSSCASDCPTTNTGSPSSSGSSAPRDVEARNATASAGETVRLAYSGTVSEIAITSAESISGMEVTVEKLAARPADVADLGNVYQYLNITKVNGNASSITATITFKVENSWLSSNGFSEGSVSMYRHNGKWTKLYTGKVGRDDAYTYYEAATTGFSVFAISAAAVRSCPACPDCGPLQNCTSGNTTKTCYYCDETTGYACRPKEMAVPCPVQEPELGVDALAIASIAVIIVVIVLVAKKKKLFIRMITRENRYRYRQ